MPRFHQLLFIVSLLALSWIAMMAVHEFGHVVGAMATGGSVEQVVLHPFSISRTDVLPNPSPALVVWLGPLLGCILPVVVFAFCPQRFVALRKTAQFFAGFCLVANGAYIAIGSFDQVGDCGEMFRTGTPLWAMLLFGAVAIPFGFLLWHQLGPLDQLMKKPSIISPRMSYVAAGLLLVVLAAAFALSPR